MGVSIIRSIKEPLDNFANNLISKLNNADVDCNECYAEELLFSNFFYTGNDLKEVIYFFNNVKSAGALVHLLKMSNKDVINGDFLRKNFSKEVVQLILYQNGFQVPQNYFSPEISRLSKIKDSLPFPLILKSFRHSEKYFVLNSYTEYLNFAFQWESNESFYAEEFLVSDYKAFKSYIVDGAVYFDTLGDQVKTEELIEDIKRIGSIFSLNIYSIDYIFNTKNRTFFIIDVNSSPAFAGSENAGKSFIQYLKRKSEKYK